MDNVFQLSQVHSELRLTDTNISQLKIKIDPAIASHTMDHIVYLSTVRHSDS